MHRLNEPHLSSLNEPPSTGPRWCSPWKQWGYYREGHQTSRCNYTASVQALRRVHCNSSDPETPKSNCYAFSLETGWLAGYLTVYKWTTEDNVDAKALSCCVKQSSSNCFIPCCTSAIAANCAAGQVGISLFSLMDWRIIDLSFWKMFKPCPFILPCPSPTTAPTWWHNERVTPFTSSTHLLPSPTSVLFCDLYLTVLLCMQKYVETPLRWLHAFLMQATELLLHLLLSPCYIWTNIYVCSYCTVALPASLCENVTYY